MTCKEMYHDEMMTSKELYVEIFRKPLIDRKAFQDVLKNGLVTKANRTPAAEVLDMKNEWMTAEKGIGHTDGNEDDQEEYTARCINEFANAYWALSLERGDFAMVFSGEGQHRLFMGNVISCASNYDVYQPRIQEGSLSHDLFVNSGVLDKKEIKDDKELNIEKAKKLDYKNLLKKSFKEGQLKDPWKIFLSETNTDEVLANPELHAEEFLSACKEGSRGSKLDGKKTGYISPIERAVSFIDSMAKRHKVTKSKVTDKLEYLPKQVKTYKRFKLDDKPVESREVFDEKYPKPDFLNQLAYQEYLEQGKTDALNGWRTYLAIKHKDSKKPEYPPFQLSMDDIDHLKTENKFDLVACNNSILFAGFLRAFTEFGNEQEEEQAQEHTAFLLHWHNDGGNSFQPHLCKQLEVLNISIDDSNLILNPKLGATLLLSYIYNACMFFDKNDSQFRIFLVKLRRGERGSQKLEEILGESINMIIPDFRIFKLFKKLNILEIRIF